MIPQGSLYIQDTEFAARADIITAIESQQGRLRKLKDEVEMLYTVADFAESVELFDPRLPENLRLVPWVVHLIGKLKRWEANLRRPELDQLEQELLDKRSSLSALSGALIQIAKQGISLVNGGKKGPARGRSVAGVPLNKLVWAARNQSLHYESPPYHKLIMQVFKELESAYGDVFSLAKHSGENLGYEVLLVLEWTSYDKYLADMQALL